jgi:hypothetical protein
LTHDHARGRRPGEQARTPDGEALLDQIAEPLRIAIRPDAVVRGVAEPSTGVDGVTVAIEV